MKPAQLVRSLLTRGIASERKRRAIARWLERRRKRRGEPHRVEYFHQVDDPYSHLAAQALAPLLESYHVTLEVHLVGPPPDEAAAERELLVAYSRKDAADIAPFRGLSFHDPGVQPPATRVRRALRILAHQSAQAFATVAPRVGEALWSGDDAALEALAQAHGQQSESGAERVLEAGTARRRRLGHYLGAMFHYGAEWYWGVDRLHHLERRLAELGAHREDTPAERFAPPEAPKSDLRDDGSLTLEYFPSLRSPYTYISMAGVYEMARRTGVKLVLRPVLPMVMRGVPAPFHKGRYIMWDTKREAARWGVPFGKVADPIGEPVERGFSLFPWARSLGRAENYLLSFARAAWAEGIDAGSDAGLRRIVERAGLSWGEARVHLGDDAWRAELEANRLAMYEMGVWGVPSFRLLGSGDAPDFVTWGQDRIWLVETHIQARLQERQAGRPGAGA